MAVYPIVWEPIARTGAYRNMQRRDVHVWERWIERHGREYDQVAYDVAIGGVVPTAPDLPERDVLGYKYTTALKIDALVRRPAGATIIEVKSNATVSAIGAAVSYQVLWDEQGELPELEASGIACELLPPDLAVIAERLGLLTWVV